MPGFVRHRAACPVRSARRQPPARAARPNRTPPRIRITTPSTPGTRPGTVYGLTWSSSKRGIAALATTIAKRAPIATRLIIECVDQGLDGSLEAGLGAEARGFLTTLRTEDAAEGIQAFLQKRPPGFKGR